METISPHSKETAPFSICNYSLETLLARPINFFTKKTKNP
jgi:hypothetical protein